MNNQTHIPDDNAPIMPQTQQPSAIATLVFCLTGLAIVTGAVMTVVIS